MYVYKRGAFPPFFTFFFAPKRKSATLSSKVWRVLPLELGTQLGSAWVRAVLLTSLGLGLGLRMGLTPSATYVRGRDKASEKLKLLPFVKVAAAKLDDAVDPARHTLT